MDGEARVMVILFKSIMGGLRLAGRVLGTKDFDEGNNGIGA